jgi:hypothetical protein
MCATAATGILVWRSELGKDGTIVTGNRIERIGAKSGGSSENGNDVNVFRAGGVLMSGNHIVDCAFSAIRSNSGSNSQMIGISCARLGEVALYAEFALEGAVIANNLIDKAAMGISVTKFKQGGRLAVVQLNLVRNPQGRGFTRHRHHGGGRQRGERQCDRRRPCLRYPHRLGQLSARQPITGANDGAIRAMDGAKPVGPDLAKASAEAYPNLAIYANVAR